MDQTQDEDDAYIQRIEQEYEEYMAEQDAKYEESVCARYENAGQANLY